MGKSDLEVLDGSPFVVTLNGVDYEWRQHPRNVQRKARARLMGLTVFFESANSEKDEAKKSAIAIDALSQFIDFCDEYCPDMADDIDNIERYVIGSGIEGFSEFVVGVYVKVVEEWLAPWVSGGDDTGKKPKTSSAKSTAKRNTTK